MAANLAPSPSPSASLTPAPDKQINDVLSDATSAKKGLDDSLGAYQTREADISKREAGQMAGLEKQAGDLKAPTFEPVPAPTPKTTDPQKAWASSAMILGMLASAFTRKPLNTAMNAAAGVMTAYHKGDVEAANTAFESWKVANENAIKAMDFQQEAYKNAMAGVERREKTVGAEATAAERDARAQLTAQMSAFNDQIGLDRLKVEGIQGVQHLMDARDKAKASAEANTPKLVERNAVASAYNSWLKTPEGQAADPMAKLKKYQELIHYHAPKQAKEMDPLQQDKTKQAIVSKFNASVPGKAYQAASSNNSQIQALAKSPDIMKNPASQIQMLDKFLSMSTGSTRPGIAQYHTYLSAQTLNDYLKMKQGLIKYHPLLGPDQVSNMAKAANIDAAGAQQEYSAFLARPENRDIAEQVGMLPKSHGQAEGQHTHYGPPPPEAVAELKKNPKTREQFDEAFGPGSAQRALGN